MESELPNNGELRDSANGTESVIQPGLHEVTNVIIIASSWACCSRPHGCVTLTADGTSQQVRCENCGRSMALAYVDDPLITGQKGVFND